jgi:UDP-N-acetylmuramate--alanine ligase
MKENILTSAKNIHFIGIGGIGISAIARLLLLEGKKVSGSDISLSEVTDELSKVGAIITEGQDLNDIKLGTDLIIFTAAIEVADQNLYQKIKKLSIPSLSYSEALGLVSSSKKTIAVSGTHGKTTTTAMIAKVLTEAKIDPSVIVGSMLLESKSNYRAGLSEYLVVEADEYRRSFLSLQPYILVINNLDADHLDYYKDLADVQSAFRSLVLKVPADGLIICNPSDENVKPVLENVKCKILDYTKIDFTDVKLKFPGEHNRQNARVALAVSETLEVDEKVAKKALENFVGTWRRFEYKGETKNGALVYDDYAHNPQKVAAVLAGTKEMYPDKKIIAVFQPHLFSRTKTLLQEFSECFKNADEVILLPIYPAREAFDPTISSEILAEKIKQKVTVKSKEEVVDEIKNKADKNSVVIFIGAGDVYKLSEQVIK